ncbi:hypothetical protein LSH36_3591g00006 [Paralvinella palmiformis]|uniref:C-type lectin domain-containing protein n=1 Tax=Paralvinella palmiformis TaxID=53620 RepID=A0AAD9MMM2_9ANNE|nr:hypothetical protein LSH36_3591g00006 [Paralvinella palmiformis]
MGRRLNSTPEKQTLKSEQSAAYFIETKPSSLSFGLWLGASKSVEGVDVIWSHTMKAVIGSNYRNLDYGESMRQASGNNCLKSFRGQWSLAPCSKIKAFVCEY